MRGLEKNCMGRGHIYIYIHRHRDLLTNSAQRAELVKIIKNLVCIVWDFLVLVLLSAHVERFSVSRMREFFLAFELARGGSEYQRG